MAHGLRRQPGLKQYAKTLAYPEARSWKGPRKGRGFLPTGEQIKAIYESLSPEGQAAMAKAAENHMEKKA
jgi:hypothetical protein